MSQRDDTFPPARDFPVVIALPRATAATAPRRATPRHTRAPRPAWPLAGARGPGTGYKAAEHSQLRHATPPSLPPFNTAGLHTHRAPTTKLRATHVRHGVVTVVTLTDRRGRGHAIRRFLSDRSREVRNHRRLSNNKKISRPLTGISDNQSHLFSFVVLVSFRCGEFDLH